MHGDISLAGPLWVVSVGLVIVTAGLALFVVVQSMRPRYQPAAERLREPLWTYTVGQSLFLAVLLLLQLAEVPVLSGLLLVLIPLSLIQSFAFMLRVIWPRGGGTPPSDA